MIDGKPWTPENAAQEVEGNMSVSMRAALAASNNRATVDLVMKTGLEQVVEKNGAVSVFDTDQALPVSGSRGF